MTVERIKVPSNCLTIGQNYRIRAYIRISPRLVCITELPQMPERRPVLPHSIDRVDVVFVQGTSIVGRINVTPCNVHRQIVEVPAEGNSTFVEPFAGAVAKVEESVNRDNIGIASMIPKPIATMRPRILTGRVVWKEESFKIIVSAHLN